MKTAFVGGGAGCRAVLEMVNQDRLSILDLEIAAVVDVDPDAPGFVYAQGKGWSTYRRVEEAMNLPGLELVVELNGSDEVLEEIHRLVRPGVVVMDHHLAKVFWDLDKMCKTLQAQLEHKTELEGQAKRERARLQEVLDSLPDVVMVMDRDRRIVQVNRRFEEAFGTNRRDARDLVCFDSFGNNGTYKHCFEEDCPFDLALETKKAVTFVHYDDGRRRPKGHY